MPPDINSLAGSDQPRPAGHPARQPENGGRRELCRRSAGSVRIFRDCSKGTTSLAIDARKNLDSLTTLIDQSKPVLDSQTDSSDAVQAWAANLAIITKQLQSQDAAVRGVINKGGRGG